MFVMHLVVFFALGAVALGHDYSDINTKFNFEPFMKDKAAFKKQVDCALDRGPCDEIAEHYKRHILEATSDACAGCSAKLKHNIRVFLQELSSQFPEDYTAFRAKYDPDGDKFALIEAAVEKF